MISYLYKISLYFSLSLVYTQFNDGMTFEITDLRVAEMLTSLPTEVPPMDILTYVILMQIKDMAAGMTREEVLATFSIDEKNFSKDEEVYFTEFYNYGRGMAVATVVNNLVESSKGRHGQAAAMAFLRRFAKEFEGVPEGDSSGSFSFSFGEPKE